MARLWSCGFELQSVTSGIEWDSSTGSPSIDTTTKRSGAASMRCNLAATNGYLTHTFAANGNTNNVYVRFYFRIATAPGSLTPILRLRDLGPGLDSIELQVNSNRTLELWDGNANTQIGSDSSALSLNQWYRLEVGYVNGTTTVTAYIDGVSFASGSIGAFADNPNQIRLGVITSNTCDFYFDDVGINDQTTSLDTGLPGDAKIANYLRPNAAGDNNDWLKSGGGAGDSTNYQDLDEVTPDDATSYVKRTGTGTKIDDYNVESSATAGIGASDTIKFVAIGFWGGATSATATGRDIVLRIKGQAVLYQNPVR